MIRKYSEWLKESEIVPPATQTTSNQTVNSTEKDLTPEEMEDVEPVEPVEQPTEPTEPVEQGTDPVTDEIQEYQNLDQARKEAIKAFKAKQEEFLQIPRDTRINPVSDEDKTKVETLKTELIDLNRAMQDAISAWDSFNAKALGIEDDDDDIDIDDEP